MTRTGIEIRTGHREVADAVGRLVDLAVRHGAWIHPAARIEEHHGQLGVYAGGDAEEGADLIRLPDDLLVPVQRARWTTIGDRFVVDRPDPAWTRVHHALAEALAEVHTVTGKVAWTRTALPWFTLHDRPAMVEAVRALRPRFPDRRPELADAFLHSRTLAQPGGVQVLMPLVELLNHHVGGGVFLVEHGGLRVRVRRPGGTGECVARYHAHADPLDLALSYGFLDPAASAVRCAPVRIEVDPIGTITVEGRNAAPVHRLDPPRVSIDDEGIVLSHLLFERSRRTTLTELLQLPVRASLRRHGVADRRARTLTSEILDGLIRTHREQATATRRILLDDGDRSPAAPLLVAALDRQVDLVDALLADRRDPRPDEGRP